MKIEFKKDDRYITIDSQVVLLPGPIWHIREEPRKVIVVLDPDWGLRNVFCYDENAQLLWVIEETEYFKGIAGPGYQMVYRFRHGNKELVADVRGRPFYLDIETGKVSFIDGDFER